MKQLTQYFNESLLDDEDIQINDETPVDILKIEQWLDKHDSEPEAPQWRDWGPRLQKYINITKTGIEINNESIDFDLYMGDDISVPDYINFKGNGRLILNTDLKTLIVNSKEITNLSEISIFGKKLENIKFTGRINCQKLCTYCPSLKVLNMQKSTVETLDLTDDPSMSLDFSKCKLPNSKKTYLTEDQVFKILEEQGIKNVIISYSI